MPKPSIQQWCVGIAFTLALFSKSAFGHTCAAAERQLVAYLQLNLCSDSTANRCLASLKEELSPHVYYWRNGSESWKGQDGQTVQHLLPHFLLSYLRRLRDFYSACGLPKEDQAWTQVEAITAQAQLRLASDMPTSLVWENRYGYAQGMEQAEISAYLASLATVYQKHGKDDKALRLMRLALQMVEALSKPIGVNSGGVRSTIAEPCGNDIVRISSCFWFHSRGLSIDTDNEEHIATVLNQHLHVIYDVLLLYKTIHGGGAPIPPEYGPRAQLLARLEGYVAGGLGQLAYGRGNSARTPDAPPNMVQFMNRRQSDTRPHYLAYYRFDMTTHKGRNIRWKNVCHYHTHVLTKLAHIKTLLDKHPEVFRSSPSGQGQFLYSAIESLFSGAGEPMGLIDAKAPVWQLWLTQRVKYTLAGCPACDGTACSPEDTYVDTYYSTLNWVH